MKKNVVNFCIKDLSKIFLFALVCCGFIFNDIDAATVKRGTVRANPQVATNKTSKGSVAKTSSATKTAATKVIDEESDAEPENLNIENKGNQFGEFMADSGYSAENMKDSALADKIRAQRAALDAAAAAEGVEILQSGKNNQSNKCDAGLRKCMQAKCGDKFIKCATDTATIFGDKMDACRRDTQCTAHEYSLYTVEIMADRDQNVKLASYDAIIDCGNKYNNCIFTECGPYLNKCLGKTAGDAAISKCSKIAKSCTEQDSGLASRVANVFGTLRQSAEKDIKADEERLYKLRDKMREQCSVLGALFDERSLDCVYTVNLFANNDNETPKASKKLYAGGTFNCTPDWFGIDITTFKENAYRETRAQTAASSAMLGSGIGAAAGLVTSGAVGRALETQKAAKDLKKAECAATGGEWNPLKNKCEDEDDEDGKKEKVD